MNIFQILFLLAENIKLTIFSGIISILAAFYINHWSMTTFSIVLSLIVVIVLIIKFLYTRPQ